MGCLIISILWEIKREPALFSGDDPENSGFVGSGSMWGRRKTQKIHDATTIVMTAISWSLWLHSRRANIQSLTLSQLTKGETIKRPGLSQMQLLTFLMKLRQTLGFLHLQLIIGFALKEKKNLRVFASDLLRSHASRSVTTAHWQHAWSVSGHVCFFLYSKCELRSPYKDAGGGKELDRFLNCLLR